MAMRGNLFAYLPTQPETSERLENLAVFGGARVERIVSTGQASDWFDQDWSEWVALLAGEAVVEIAGEAQPHRLQVGDWLLLPAQCRHRVVFTSTEPAAVWLAVHGAAEPPRDA